MAGGNASIAALSRLGSLGGATRNQFFDPTGQDAAMQDAEWGASDQYEAQTGLNPTAHHELAMRQMQDLMDELDFRQSQRRNQQRTMDASWLGPEGWARTSPDIAAGERSLYLGDERVAHDAANLPTQLHMEHDKLLNQEQAKAEGYWIPQNVSAREDQRRNAEDVLGQKNDLALQQAQAKGAAAQLLEFLKGKTATDVATIRAGGQEEDAAARVYAQMAKRGDVNVKDAAEMATLRANAGMRGGGPGPGGAAPGGSPNGTPPDGTLANHGGVPAVWRANGPLGAGWYDRRYDPGPSGGR